MRRGCLVLLLFVWVGAVADESRSDHSIYLIRRGWHTDVGFATAELSEPLKSIAGYFPGAVYLVFGFGDRRYLTESHRTTPAMLAALWPGDGLLLVTGLGRPPGDAFGPAHVRTFRLSAEQGQAAMDFLWWSFLGTQLPAPEQLRPSAEIRSIGPGPYDGSLYFSARQRYSAVYTCNTWAADVLHHADLPLNTTGIFFSSQLWRRSRKLGAADR